MQHDASYKQFFNHPRMVEDLLHGYAPKNLVKALNFSTLAKADTTLISDDLQRRESDSIRSILWGERRLYIYILLEFQSTPDRCMAVCILGYVSLLYQSLIQQQLLSKSILLPPLLP